MRPVITRTTIPYYDTVHWEIPNTRDFTFFSGRGGRGIGHVGIVVGIEPGAVYMLNSGTSPGVCVQNFLAMPYYKKRYVGARRVF